MAIDRMLASGHRPRSVLVSRQKYERMAALLDPLDVPVYVVDAQLLQDIVGFDLHRGAIAAGDRKPMPSLDEIVDTTRRIAVLESLNDPENLGAVARSARALGIGSRTMSEHAPVTSSNRASSERVASGLGGPGT